MNKTKEKLKIFIIIFFITLLFCIPYLLPHKITDTYWNIGEGIQIYKFTPLKDGRIIHFLILFSLELLGIKMEIYSIVVHYICVIIYALSIYNVYTYIITLLYKKEQRKNNKIIKSIILISSTLIILNPLTVENFAYIENIIMSLGIFIGTISARILNENKKNAYLKSLILIIIAGLCYQGNLNMWIALSVLYYAINEKKTIKQWGIYLFKIVSISILTLIFLVIILNLTNFILGIEQSRLGISIQEIGNYINLFVFFVIKILTDSTFGYYPKMLIIINILISILLIVNFEKRKPINSMLKYCFKVIIIIISCICPAFLQSQITLSARIINGIGAIIGISIIYLCYILVKEENYNKIFFIILLTFSAIMFIINLFDYYNIAYMNHITMKEEKQYINKINNAMLEYEKENDITLKNVMFFKDSNYEQSYDNLPINTFTSRAIGTSYSRKYCLNYYTGRNLKEKVASEEKYNKYFKEKDWNEFNIEQVQFENDTVYICIY